MRNGVAMERIVSSERAKAVAVTDLRMTARNSQVRGVRASVRPFTRHDTRALASSTISDTTIGQPRIVPSTPYV